MYEMSLKPSDIINKALVKDLPIRDITLDIDNPRIQLLIDSYKFTGQNTSDINDELIKTALFASRPSKSFNDLKKSIQKYGLKEPIWVYEKDKDTYVVIEGNTRKLIFDILHEENPYDDAWTTIKARVVPENTSKDVIVFLRIDAHMGGVEPWAPYERARYLYTLNKDQGYTVKELQDLSRTSQNEIKYDLRAFEVMQEQFINKYSDSVDDPKRKYNYFVEYVKNKKFRNLEEGQKVTVEEFSHWVSLEKIPRAIDVRDLPKILDDDESAKIFREKGYQAAIDHYSYQDPGINSPIFRDIEKITESLKELRLYEIDEIKNDPAKTSKLEGLVDTINKNFLT